MLDERFRALKQTRPPDLWPAIEGREPRPARREIPWGRLGTAALALAVAAAGIAFAARAFLGEEQDRPLPRQEPEPAPLDPRVTASVEVGPQPMAVAAGEGSVWVLVLFPDDPPHTRLIRVEPSTNEVVAEIPIGASGEDLAVGLGSVWVPQYRQDEGALLLRVDASTNEIVAEIPGAGGQPVVGHGSVWAVGGRSGNEPPGTVVRVDPETNRVVAEIPMPFEPPPFDIVAGTTSVWVLGLNDHRGPDLPNLVRIDPDTNAVVDAIDLDGAHTSMVGGGGYVWFPGWLHDFEDVGTGSDDRGVVVRVDERTGAVLPDPVGFEAFRPFAFGEGGVWTVGWPTEQNGGICRLNSASLEVDVCVEPPSLAEVYGDWAALDPTTSTIWVIGEDGYVARIDLQPA
jgi:hypothetical protein